MRKFNKSEDAFLRKNYKKVPCKRMAKFLGRSEGTARQRLKLLGIEVPPEIIQKFKDESRFKKGHVSHNKGKRMPKELYKKCAPTMFRKGHSPVNWKPVGSERICSKDGYVIVKTQEPRTWKHKHVVLWEKKRGKVKNGFAVMFRDGDKQNIRLSNLKLVSRAQLMKKNSYHNYPKEIAQVIQLKGALTRQINKHAKHQRPA